MDGRKPSRTASGAAGYRAAHQITDDGSIFKDPYARLILDEEALATADERARDPTTRHFRLFMAARSRFAEDCLAAEVERGLRQVVILGAGLDTFGLRNPYRDAGLRVFEVDHPATQTWKRSRLAALNLTEPEELVFVPVDFEHEDLTGCLGAAGFRADQPAFYIWLGVVPYLERKTVLALLEALVVAPETAIVFDYSEPLENYSPERRARVMVMEARVAAAGEPWITHFDPSWLTSALISMGYTHVEDLGPAQVATRYFGAPTDPSDGGAGPHIVLVRKTPLV